MTLDITTLMTTGAFVALLSAIFLFGAWLQDRRPPLAWWAAAQFAGALGVSLMVVGAVVQTIAFVAVGGFIATSCMALTWAGARTFSQRPVGFVPLAAGPVVNLIASAIPAVGGDTDAPMLVGFTVAVAYLFAAAGELWSGREEPLSARWPLIGLFVLHGAVHGAGIYDVAVGAFSFPQIAPPLQSGFGLIHFESLVYSLGAAVCMLLIVKERSELRYKVEARTDALTGLANRAAFFGRAERMMARSLGDGSPFSVIVFDLDYFKNVNDTQGHAAGDRVLQLFADTLVSVLRPQDLAGRHGGEEFAVALPEANVETAYIVADRVRHAFAEICYAAGDLRMPITASGGVAQAWPSAHLHDVVGAADEALYVAKRLGRNRVERATISATKDGEVVRVA